jgi:hypothetical protein
MMPAQIDEHDAIIEPAAQHSLSPLPTDTNLANHQTGELLHVR